MDHFDEHAVVPAQGQTLRNFVVFQIKLALDGVKDMVVIGLSVIAILTDLIAGRRSRPRMFYGVVRMSHRFEKWLRLHHMRGAEGTLESPSPLADVLSETPDADELIDRFEDLVRKEISTGDRSE